MPTIEINGAQLYYETFGQDRPGQAPVLLIHGSTGTGQNNWGEVAPLLACRWKVIVPDCRGHGQSSNPGLSYSFKEMAGDMAALVRALGYPTAHVIGHSNGGNVALVTLMEHPEVVQTCIPQAANAWVSPELFEREPAVFNPERIRREAPEWHRELTSLHTATHGPEYWRTLLQLTLDEILREPNYTAEQLGAVDRPVLVIQGAQDPVNAPARHAQFIARHIPCAEQWIPEGVAHTVHEERLAEWLSRVEDFLERRGSPEGEALQRLKCERYADARQGMFEVRAQRAGGGLRLVGRVLTDAQRAAAVERVQQVAGQATGIDLSGLKVLLNAESAWALVNRPVDDLRREPRSLAERVSQAILGEACRVLDESSIWSLVRMEHDGYIGWIHSAALQRCTFTEAQAYLAACRWQVVDELLHATLQPEWDGSPGELAGKLVFATRVALEAEAGPRARLRLPDGRAWWVDRAGLTALGAAGLGATAPGGARHAGDSGDAGAVNQALELVQRFIGVPYLWGGRSPYGYDCSGLAGTFYAYLGKRIPRDADQQYHAAAPVNGTAQPGDLLFFGEQDDPSGAGRIAAITHVAISLGGDEFVHANGAAWGISINSLNPDSPRYRAWLKDNLVGMGRFA